MGVTNPQERTGVRPAGDRFQLPEASADPDGGRRKALRPAALRGAVGVCVQHGMEGSSLTQPPSPPLDGPRPHFTLP
ncbi:hypothetical protein E2C01_045610 [Portunus trituberculatus]|uniref:Uncharacterized protein n=1 Tax=Portunus trituberculatus TaxID=210409 RepID=A0A5B7G2H6_PORTR|nr:hypothetical protein [Portunus trituberculatus]